MPSAAFCVVHSDMNSLVMITAVGRPRVSNWMPSCKLHDVHDPQSPIAVITTSFALAIAAIIAGSAVYEKPRFT